MPIGVGARQLILDQLNKVRAGVKVYPIEIGYLTEVQHAEINRLRDGMGFPGLGSPIVLYVGRHHYKSRSADGYTIEDMADQLESGLAHDSIVVATHRMTALINRAVRVDPYGIEVNDMVILELTARKPKAEAFSAIPKGDKRK